MSLAMRVSRYGNMGDPGLFGFLGGVIKGGVTGFLTGGPAGAVLGASAGVASAINAGSRPSVTQARAATMFPAVSQARPQMPGGFSGVNVGGPSGVTIGTVKPGGAVVPTRTQFTDVRGGSSSTAPRPACGIAGHHYNKSTYYTSHGAVPAGTKCVRNRKRNPLNPRALSRAMSRVASAQRAVKCLQLFAGAPARASHAANSKGRFGKRGSCKSCKTR